MERLRDAGIRQVNVTTHYLADRITSTSGMAVPTDWTSST